MKRLQTDVLIAGAGPVGLATALFLDHLGVAVEVVESHAGPASHSYALALHPETLRILEPLGVAGEILPRSHPVSRLAVYSRRERLREVTLGSLDDPMSTVAVVGQHVLERSLAQMLQNRGVRIHWSHRLSGFRQDGELVRSEVDQLEQRLMGYATARLDWMVSRTLAGESRFLVGADGYRSITRRILQFEFQEVRPATSYAVFELPARLDDPHELRLVVGPDGVIDGLWPMRDGCCRWSFQVGEDVDLGRERSKESDLVQIFGSDAFPVLPPGRMAELLAERAPWFPVERGSSFWRSLVRFDCRLSEGYGRGAVWLAGDSAHLTGPLGMQSMNQGLREARDLAFTIADALQAGGRPGDRFLAYEEKNRGAWLKLLGQDPSPPPATGDTPALLAASADRLLASLPATGDRLDALFSGLGFGGA